MKIILFAILFFVLLATPVSANIGISPSSYTNTNLLSGSVVATEIVLSFDNAAVNRLIKVERNLGEIDSWVELRVDDYDVDKGESSKKVSLLITVPEDVDQKMYLGSLIFVITNNEGSQQGNVLQTGIKYDIKLGFSNKNTGNLTTKSIKFKLPEGGEQIVLSSKIENTSNAPLGMSRIELEINDLQGNFVTNLISDQVKEVSANSVELIETSFQHDLEPGNYLVNVKFNNMEQVFVIENQLLTINDNRSMIEGLPLKINFYLVAIIILGVIVALKFIKKR